jgi:hypothetical protein
VDRPDGIPETLCDYACFDGEVRTVGHLGRISCPGIILQ